MLNKRLVIIIISVAILLLIPLIAMQFTTEVNWTLTDFAVAGILLLSTGFLCEMVLRKIPKTKHRIAVCLSLLIILVLIWVELAVGIFDSPYSGT
jgi:predicted permease